MYHSAPFRPGLGPRHAAGEPPAERIRRVTEARATSDLLGHGPDEVADPHGRSKRAHRLAADRLALLVDALLDGLYGASA